MYGAGDVRVEQRPDATVRQPTDAVVRVVRSAICGSDLGLRVDATLPAGPAHGP